MTVVFRCNAGPSIGLGHLTRCRALAHALRVQGQQCIMVGPEYIYRKLEDSQTFDDWIPVTDWITESEDAEKILGIAQHYHASWLVLDDYRIDEIYQRYILTAGLRWLQFEVRADRPLWADIIVNASPNANSRFDKKNFKNKSSIILTGEKFCILRDDYTKKSRNNSSNFDDDNIFVCFGGCDDNGGIEFVLRVLSELDISNSKVNIISGKSNPQIQRIKKIISTVNINNFSLLIEPVDFISIFSNSKIAIISGGTLVYEAAFLGVPSVIIRTANNQLNSSTSYAHYAGDLFSGYKIENFKALFSELYYNHEKLRRMSECGSYSVDGLGASRIAGYMINSNPTN